MEREAHSLVLLTIRALSKEQRKKWWTNFLSNTLCTVHEIGMYIAKTEPLSDFALALNRRLLLDHQIARKIDLEVHKDKMKGNFYIILSKAQIKQKVKDVF